LPSDLPTPGAFVDPACPIDWDHPLNKGLVADWTIIPNSGWSRGNTLRDLVRGGKKPNDGALTNGPTWAGGLNGFGALSFAKASSQYVAAPYNAATMELTYASVAATVRVASIGAGAETIIVNRNYDGSSVAINLSVAGGNNPGFGFFNGAWRTSGIGATSIVADGLFHRVCGTYDGTTLRFYLDGVEMANTPYTGTLPAGNTNDLHVGRYANDSSYFDGTIQSLLIANRAWSASRVEMDYQESRRGNPERLCWVSSRAWSIPADQPVNTANVWLLGV
jgi:hypothetical protein